MKTNQARQIMSAARVHDFFMRFLAWAVSRWNGRHIGEIRYIQGTPCVAGNIRHFLPPALWTAEDRNALRYCAYKERWDGFRWVFVERITLTHEEWREFHPDAAVPAK